MLPRHIEGKRLVLLGSQSLWAAGPRQPLERAWLALKEGHGGLYEKRDDTDHMIKN